VKPIARKSLLAEVAAKAAWQGDRSSAAVPGPELSCPDPFISDPAKLKVVLCTRRSGESYGAFHPVCCRNPWRAHRSSA
jgi:hypothetical protein